MAPHRLPSDMRTALATHTKARRAWQTLTPLAQTEWICWVISVKKPETRAKHLRRFVEELAEGTRRPCCWAGCPHR